MGFFDIFKKKPAAAGAETGPQAGEQTGSQVAAAAGGSASSDTAAAVADERGQQELNAGLERTKTGLFARLARAVAGRSTIDAEVLDNLEEVLVGSDVGVETTVKIIERIEARAARDKYMNASELQRMLREEVAALLEEAHATEGNYGLDAAPGEPFYCRVGSVVSSISL